MRHPRVDEYARLLVGRCVGVQPGWDVLIRSTPLARPLVEAVIEEIARRDTEPILQLNFETVSGPLAREAPLERVREASPLVRRLWTDRDAIVAISAPENTAEGTDLPEERRRALEQRLRPMRARTMAMKVPWVGCEYPVPATVQDAGMTLAAFEEFVYGAVLLDWDAEGAKMRRIADRFDAASEVRIVGDGTDLTLSLEGRTGAVDDGHLNMPGGEVFYAPVEDSAEGVVTFSEFPAVRFGREVNGARLRFEGGRAVDAAALSNEAFLHEMLAIDEGASRLGELGIGCNRAIQRFSRNVAFDEKIDGTVHLALGSSYSFIGGRNTSAIHWDIVKDLRGGGRLYAHGELVQEAGAWLM
jgi:aminopeptidase